MSGVKERQFVVKGSQASPFIPSKTSKEKSSTGLKRNSDTPSKGRHEEEQHGPSGSLWGLQHLNWLHIHFALGYDLPELFSSGSDLADSSKIAMHLQHTLGVDWKWICSTEHKALSIYAHFQRLIYTRMEDDDYKTTTQASSSNSPSSSESQPIRSSISPQPNLQNAPSRQGR